MSAIYRLIRTQGKYSRALSYGVKSTSFVYTTMHFLRLLWSLMYMLLFASSFSEKVQLHECFLWRRGRLFSTGSPTWRCISHQHTHFMLLIFKAHFETRRHSKSTDIANSSTTIVFYSAPPHLPNINCIFVPIKIAFQHEQNIGFTGHCAHFSHNYWLFFFPYIQCHVLTSILSPLACIEQNN